MEDNDQLERFGEVVEEKKKASKEASEQPGPQHESGHPDISGDQRSLTEHGRPQDARDERAKNSGHGKKTADKWNQ
jgi:hypothetical protein